MARKTAKQTRPGGRTPVAALDLGPAVMIRRGEIVREDRADPDAPNRTLAAARRRDGLRELHRRGHITDAQWAAGERLRDDMEFAAGARDRTPDFSGVRSTSRDYGPGRLQLDAQTRVNAAHKAVGGGGERQPSLLLIAALSWVVIYRSSVAAFAREKRMREAQAMDAVRLMLDRLAEFYSTIQGSPGA